LGGEGELMVGNMWNVSTERKKENKNLLRGEKKRKERVSLQYLEPL
jgi:hypothetical protein